MEVAVYKDYNEDGVNMLIASDEMLSMGFSVTDVATRDIPGPVTVPQVAEDKQALIKEGDIPDADGNFVMRYDDTHTKLSTAIRRGRQPHCGHRLDNLLAQLSCVRRQHIANAAFFQCVGN